MTRFCPELLGLAKIVKPESILRWHRMGFRAYWRWKSRKRAGRPKIDRELRDLVRRMCLDNPLWSASRIHGELLKVGFEVAHSTVLRYMVRGRRPPSQSWKTFLHRFHGHQRQPTWCATVFSFGQLGCLARLLRTEAQVAWPCRRI